MAELPADAAGGLSAARPALIRAMNEQLLLEHIRASGPCSRADLARVSRLSKPTVSLALANLERAGLVWLAGQRTGVPGRSALLYEVRPEAGFVLGLDIGMQFLRGAIADLSGTVRAHSSRAVVASGPVERVAELVRLADDLCHEAGIARSSVTQTVVGSPGVYDLKRDLITLTGGLPGWDQPEALSALRSAFGPALVIENDVNAATLAERAHGVGKETENFAFVHVGTGIAMGLVLGGRLYRGAHGVAGEIAYMPLGGPETSAPDHVPGLVPGGPDGPDGPDRVNPDRANPDEARRRGALETAAAADGIVRAARRTGMRGDITARSVFAAAADGDPRATAVVAGEARLVASAVCCVVTVVDPSLVVLGGGVGQAPGFAEMVRAELAIMAPVMPEVRVSALGTEVVVDGCLAAATSLAWSQLVDALP